MKKYKAIVSIMLILALIIFPLTINAVQINPDHYQPEQLKVSEAKKIFEYGGRVAGTIHIVGIVVSAGTLIIIGIRYVVASAEEKAEYKERMLPYAIGAILLFGASNVVNILYKIIK